MVPVCLSSLDVCWSLLALSFLAALCAHRLTPDLRRKHEAGRLYVVLQDLIRYGKTKQDLKRDEWLRAFDVPKRWFWHFYAISVGWNCLLLLFYLNFTFLRQSYPQWLTGALDILTSGVPNTDNQVPQLSTLLVQLLLCVQSLRRLLECLFVSVFSDGAVHLVQYVFGVCYYFVLGLTVLCCDRLGKGTGALLSQLDWFHVAGIALFIAASLMQHQCMVLLARLRTGKSGKQERWRRWPTESQREAGSSWFHVRITSLSC